MSTPIWIILAVAIVLAAAPVTGGGGKKIDEKQLAKLPAKHGLPLPAALRARVLARVSPRERTALTWGFAGIAVGLLVALIVRFGTGTEDTSGPFILLGGTIGMSVGSYRGVLRAKLAPTPDAPRVARSRATSLDDYVTAPERWAVRLVPAAIALTIAAIWVIWALAPVRPGLLTPLLATGFAAATVVVWALLMHARSSLLDHPQHAHDDLELAWDDALRTAAIRDLQDTGLSLGLLGTLSLLILAGSWVIPPHVRAGAEDLTFALGLVAFATGALCWLALLIPWGVGRARRNPSLRLWPQGFGAM
ncbi:MAG TPA: hypothetical protein GXZ30_08730 [Propionibacterium sp.]|nr:hypothetical protein [Propionibacterium sp.]